MGEERSLRVLFLTHYFAPEVGAPQSRLLELASRLVAAGHSVTVVTGFPNYPTGVIPQAYRGRRSMEEVIDGVRILRTAVYATPNRGFARRIINHLSFALSSLTAWRRVGRADVIFVESPPLLIGVAALAYARLKRAPFIFNVSDIWPQSAVELGALRNRLAIRLAEMLEIHLYRRASRVSVVTPGMIERLAARGIPREKLYLLTNGVDTAIFRPAPPDVDLKKRLGLEGRKVFLYAGTHGLAQGLDVILEAATETTDLDVLYVLVGEGAERDALMQKAASRGISNVHFLPNQPRATMPALLNLAYAAIIPLKRLDLFRSALPSKMFEAMASAKPIVASVWGEAADLVDAAGCGIVVAPEDPEALREAVEKLAQDETLARRLGDSGRRYAGDHFERAEITTGFAELLRQAARDGPPGGGGPARDIVATAGLVGVSWLPVLVGLTTRTALAWLAAVALAVFVERATSGLSARVLVTALVVSSALVPSGLITDATRYLPVAVTGGALATRVAVGLWRNRRLDRPLAEPVAVVVALYLGWAAVATAASIDRTVSAVYWVGMVAVFALAFWFLPRMIPSREDRQFLLGGVGVLGVVVAATVYVGAVVGVITVFGRTVGAYQLSDLTIAGHATGIVFGRSAGVFLTPLEPSVIMVLAVLALIGWLSSMRSSRSVWLGRIAIAFIAPAIVLTLDRSAWLAAIVGAGLFAVMRSAPRQAVLTSAVASLVFAICFFGVFVNAIGANAVLSACAASCAATPGSDETRLRGGSGLTGREFLWKASWEAIKKRPIIGYGPGNNVPAIDPYLRGQGLLFKGLTSHSTWLRTAVEMGIPGLIVLLAVLAVAVWIFARDWRSEKPDVRDPTKAILAASVASLIPVMTFESLFLGGVTFSSLYLAVAIGLMLPPVTLRELRRNWRPR